MTTVNFDDYEGPAKFEAGKRYTLVVAHAEEGTSNKKGTPYIRLKLETEALQSAYDHDIYLSKKALGFAKEWFAALGLPCEGKVNVEPENLTGIRFTAEYYLEPYYINEGTADEKTLYNTKWTRPERVAVGSKPAERPMPKPTDETVPF